MKKVKKRNKRSKFYSSDYFRQNECAVNDISLKSLYRPYTVTCLVVFILGVTYISFVREPSSVADNIWAGMLCVTFALLLISSFAFPNGPFTRPHPVVWSMVFGLSVAYLLLLSFLHCQDYETIRVILLFFDPKLKDFHIDMDREYGVNCSDISPMMIWSHMDIFAAAHFLGWVFKAILVRHIGILCAMSVMWEVTELAFAHLLPNFQECWWDILVLDIILCNSSGIFVGIKLCKYLEMMNFKWVSIRDIPSKTGKLKRAVLQFTPVSWTHVRWFDSNSSLSRLIAVCLMIILWQMTELNTFFLKHIFEMPSSHPLVFGRLLLHVFMAAPSIRQYYYRVTDPGCEQLGYQCWLYLAIILLESLLCIKYGAKLFGQTQAFNIVLWVLIMVFFSVLCVYGFVVQQRYFTVKKIKSFWLLNRKFMNSISGIKESISKLSKSN